VPIAKYVSTQCVLGGLTIPFNEVQIRTLYPTFGIYYAKMKAATQSTLAAGWLLPPDAADLMQRVCAAQIRWQQLPKTPCQ